MRFVDFIIGVIGLISVSFGRFVSKELMPSISDIADLTSILVGICVITYYVLRFKNAGIDRKIKIEELKKLKKENESLTKQNKKK
jgi:hypothetical protein